jgi:stage II sporulation protein R
MKRLVIALAIGFISTLLFVSFVNTNDTENIKDSVLRIRVIANSDSEQDQSLKLAVRDSIIKEAPTLFKECSSRDEAAEAAKEKLPEIQNVAEKVVKDWGYNYTVNVEVKDQFFPTREYSDFTFPAGVYDTLAVTIGKGEGQNWWCVLFPPLCLTDGVISTKETDMLRKSGLTDNDIKILTSGNKPTYKIRFKVIELWEKLIQTISNRKSKK